MEVSLSSYVGMALAPWNVLHAGKIRTTEEEARREASGELGRRYVDPAWKRNDRQRAMCDVLEAIAKEVNVGSNIQAGTCLQSVPLLCRGWLTQHF